MNERKDLVLKERRFVTHLGHLTLLPWDSCGRGGGEVARESPRLNIHCDSCLTGLHPFPLTTGISTTAVSLSEQKLFFLKTFDMRITISDVTSQLYILSIHQTYENHFVKIFIKKYRFSFNTKYSILLLNHNNFYQAYK